MSRNTLFLSALILLLTACSGDEIQLLDSDSPENSLPDPGLSWSASSCIQFMENIDQSAFPTLTLDHDEVGAEVSFTSSNTSVASISSSAQVTVNGTGSTTISAIFKGNETYRAAKASYTLVVTSSSDEGAVITSFSPAGSADDDDISLTAFTRLVTVSYSGSSAQVSGHSAVADLMKVSVSGAGVTINYTGEENVVYKLTGTASNGYFKLYSTKKQAIWLCGLSLTSQDGAAINNQSGKRTFVYIEGTNTLADASSATYPASGDEDMKGVFFSEGQLVFSGPSSGTNTLTVTAQNAKSKSGIVSDDYVRLLSGAALDVTAGTGAGHGIKANDYVQISGGTLSISTKANMKKGITSDDYVLVEGGITTINVSGGVAYDSEDGEYTGSAGIKADNYFCMTGGSVTITNSGTGGKGIRAGSETFQTADGKTGVISDSSISGGTLTITTTGSEQNDVSSKAVKIGWSEGSENRVTANDGGITISGGVVTVSASRSEAFETKDTFTMTGGQLYATSSADDAVNCTGAMNISGGYIYANSSRNDGLDANGNLTLSGGFVFAVTTAGGAEVAIDCAEQKTLTIGNGVTMVAYPKLESGATMSQTCYSMSCTAGSWNALHNGSSYIAAFKAPSGVSSVVVSAPSLKSGYKGVSVGTETFCSGIWATSSITGGTSVSLSTYSGGGGGPGGGGHGGGGRW